MADALAAIFPMPSPSILCTFTATGSSPILGRVGRLERCLLQQAAVADAWAGAREVAEKTAALAIDKDKAAKGELRKGCM